MKKIIILLSVVICVTIGLISNNEFTKVKIEPDFKQELIINEEIIAQDTIKQTELRNSDKKIIFHSELNGKRNVELKQRVILRKGRDIEFTDKEGKKMNSIWAMMVHSTVNGVREIKGENFRERVKRYEISIETNSNNVRLITWDPKGEIKGNLSYSLGGSSGWISSHDGFKVEVGANRLIGASNWKFRSKKFTVKTHLSTITGVKLRNREGELLTNVSSIFDIGGKVVVTRRRTIKIEDR